MTTFEWLWAIAITGLTVWSWRGDKYEREHRQLLAQERAYMRRWKKQPTNYRGWAYLAAHIAVPATVIWFIMRIAQS